MGGGCQVDSGRERADMCEDEVPERALTETKRHELPRDAGIRCTVRMLILSNGAGAAARQILPPARVTDGLKQAGGRTQRARLQKRRRRCAACYMLAGFMVRMKEGILSTAKDGTAR